MTHRLYELTDYSKIYKNCYWGNFNVEKNKRLTNPLLIEARNNFIKNYNIKRYGNRRDVSIQGLDHQEVYTDCEGNIIHIYSQHPLHTFNFLDSKLQGVCPTFTLINPMYDTDQITCMRIIKKNLKI